MPLRCVTPRLIATLLVVGAAALASTLPAQAIDKRGEDWEHAKQVVDRLTADPPDAPVVYLLGGSSARESTITDADWRRQIARKGIAGVRAYNLGAAGQSYAQGVWLMDRAPGIPTLVLIGVNVGRYTPQPRSADAEDEAGSSRTAKAGGSYDQHRFHNGPRPLAQKRALVGKWLRERYPVFKKRYAQHAAVLPELVAACLDRGFRPVIVELPLDEAIVGSAWDAARHRYQKACRAVAARYHMPYVDFVADIGLVSADFYDLSHLLEPGRVKWQERLSRLVVKRLTQYHLDTVTATEGELVRQ